MFINSRFWNEGGPTAAALPTDTGSAASDSSSTQKPMSAADIFDAAKSHYFPDDEDAETDETQSEDGDASESAEDSESEETRTEPWTDKPEKDPPPVEPYKPYVFNGKVFGKDQVMEFKTQKELDRTLAQGLAAPVLYKKTKELQAKIAELEPDATYARDLVAMAKESPRELLDLIRDELMDQKTMAEWVHDNYQEFSRLAKMSDEERAREERIREANRIIEERKWLEQEGKRLQEANAEAQQAAEKREFDTWHRTEVSKWTQKVPKEYGESVQTAIRAVVAMARAQIDSGKQVTYREMSRELDKLLTPYQHAKNPAQQRREAARTMEQKKNQATTALQNATRAPATKPAQQGVPVKSAADVFDQVKTLIGQGKLKMR